MNKDPGNSKRYTVRLMGIQPGARQEVLAAALKRLYRGKSLEQVHELLGKLPLVLARSLTEEQARKVHVFLKPKGAILKVTYRVAAPVPTVKPKEIEPVPKPRETVLRKETVPPRKERRAKLRVHPGIQIRPMGVGEILDRSFRLLRQYFWLFFIIVFVPQGVYFLLSHLLGLFFRTSEGPETAMNIGIGYLILSVLFLAIDIAIVLGALTYAVSETYLGHSTSIAASYKAVWKRSVNLLGTVVLSFALVFVWAGLAVIVLVLLVQLAVTGMGGVIVRVLLGGAFIVLTAIAIHLLLNWLLVDKVVVLEVKSWLSALRRSKELMTARTEPGFWRRPKNKAGLILVLGFLIGIGIHFVFQVPGMAFSIVAPGSLLVSALMGLLNTISTSLATVYTVTAMILFYYDIRLRKEGFDLKMMAQNL